MTEVPEVLRGVLRKGDYVESLEAVRDMLGRELGWQECPACHREGPKDAKDVAALTLRLTDVLKLIEATKEPKSEASTLSGPQGVVKSLEERQAHVAQLQQRSGHGTQTTAAPTSVTKRPDRYGRRPGAGRKPGGG